MKRKIELAFLGIRFRSEHHLRHFLFSMVALGTSAFVFLFFVSVEQYFQLVFFLCVLIVCYLSVALKAAEQTGWGMLNGKMWSVDCIWFNGLMALIFFLGIIGALAHKSYFQ